MKLTIITVSLVQSVPINICNKTV